MPSRFDLQLFGHPALGDPRGDIALSPLQWALVALVFAYQGDGLSRARLLPLLWTRGSEGVLLKRLSQLIYSLDRKVGEPILLRSPTSVRPDTTLVDTDLVGFHHAIAEEDFGRASQLLEGGFLHGLPLIPTREYEDWLDRRTASLRADLRNAATRRWSRAEQEGLWTKKTLDAALALHAMNPRDEAGLRRAMWAQALASTPLEAMATYESFLDRNGLDGRDDVESDTLTLLERVRALSKQPRGGTSEQRVPSRTDPTLFGRDAELALLRPILSGPVQDGLTVVHVSGAAGLGKSRLIGECLGPAALQGRLVLKAQLAELERDIPLNALIEAFSTQEAARALEPLEEPWRSLLLHLMPDFTEVVGPALPLPPVQPASLQRRLLEAVRLLTDQVVLDQPIVVFLDDFQWVDDSSLAALEYLRRRWSKGSAVLVANVRPESIQPEGKLQSFLDAEGVIRLDLDELDDISQKQLIREVADGEISGDALASLQTLGGGNPLYLIELTRQWRDGQLTLPSRAGDEVRLPVSIMQLYEHRFRGLGSQATRMLEALAVWGKPISVGDAGSVADVDMAEATEGLEELDGLGLLRWHPEGVELNHGLIRQATLGRLSEARRRWLHLKAAQYLLAMPEPELEELALHCDRARRADQALEYSLAAANNAETVGAVTEAIRFLQIAARNSADGEAYSVRLRLADLLYLRCAYDEALAWYEVVEEDGGGLVSPEGRWRARVRGLDCRAHTDRVSFDDFISANRRLRHQASQAGLYEVTTIALASAVHHMQRANRIEAVDGVLEEATHCARAGSPRARCHGNRIAAGLTLMSGKGGDYARIAVEVAREHGLHDLAPGVCSIEVAAWVLSGRLATPEGHEVQQAAIVAAVRAGDLANHVRTLNNIAAFYLDVGEFQIASIFLTRVHEISGGSLAIPEDFHVLMNVGELALAEGDLNKAKECFLRCVPERVGQPWHGWGIAHAGLGLCAIQEGRLSDAVQHEDEMFSGIPSSSPFPVDHCICAVFTARLAAARQELPRALQILETFEHRFRGVHIPHFLRVRALRVRLASRAGQRDTASLAKEGRELAVQLQLQKRTTDFASFAASA